MLKTDYKKELKGLYSGKIGESVTVDVPPMQYLMIDGRGDPNTSSEFVDAIQALYPVAYTLKFMIKKQLEIDYKVMPLEGLFWAEDMNAFSTADKSNWLWTLMIMQPGIVTKEMYQQAVEQVAERKNPPALSKVRFDKLNEGQAAQVTYVGPYAEEGPTIAKLHAYITSQGGELNGSVKKHHEIYLNDMRRTAPEKLLTIIRQPF